MKTSGRQQPLEDGFVGRLGAGEVHSFDRSRAARSSSIGAAAAGPGQPLHVITEEAARARLRLQFVERLIVYAAIAVGHDLEVMRKRGELHRYTGEERVRILPTYPAVCERFGRW